jgi:cysteinyl-tRNA synthetase
LSDINLPAPARLGYLERTMAITFYNSLTRRTEPFEPLHPGRVGIYSCGPTVYDFPHLGNWRANVFFDLLRRYLRWRGLEVFHVMNLTDVDDKTIRGARDAGVDLAVYTEPFIEAFFRERDLLRIEAVEVYPRATEHIPEMLELVGRLEEQGLTYESGGSVYYAVERFPDYGRLSQLDAEGLKAGARVDSDEYEKDQVRDFVLWKARKPEDGEVFWPSRWGEGRPGWHIECSAMSVKYLGLPFDIHTGGVDLRFPHHENEIAQTTGATGQPLARCWLHNEHLLLEGRKMSKSLGNILTLQEIIARGYDPVAVRYVLLGTHYRQQLNFRWQGLEAAGAAIGRLREAALLWRERANRGVAGEETAESGVAEAVRTATEGFTAAMDDDLNISEGLAAVFELVRKGNGLLDAGLGAGGAGLLLETLEGLDRVLGVLETAGVEDDLEAEVVGLIEAREAARRERDWDRADRIRDDLLDRGIVLEDTPTGTRWKRRDA